MFLKLANSTQVRPTVDSGLITDQGECATFKVASAQEIDSLLPCICSVIDHRWCQNMVKTET